MNPETPSITKIHEYAAGGYLFHGSPDPNIEIFEPRQAVDENRADEFNNDNAVFASPTPASALIFSLIHFPEGTEPEIARRSWGVDMTPSGPIARMPKVWEEIIKNNKGVLYVLPADTFTFSRHNLQAKSHQVVTPFAKVPISFADFLALGGKVEFSEDM